MIKLDTRPTLLLVDDEPTNLHVLRHTLQDEYHLLFAKEGKTALKLAAEKQPDLILLDVMMPELDGYEVCTRLKNDASTRRIPVIFVTALNDYANEQRGLEIGAVDYVNKPFSPPIVRARVRTHLSLVRTEEVIESRLSIIQSLGVAAEYKDNETGMHILRMSHYCRVLAKALGYDDAAADLLFHAAPMHDVGKIGIPDAVLLKPGKLNEEEWAIMRNHTLIGERILGKQPSRLLQLAARIARSHHEKWDGTGYPDGLAGTEIPHEVRIVTLADVFDALTSVRPYKEAWPIEKAVDYIYAQSGQHFDPEVVAVLAQCLPEFMEIKARWRDE